MTLRAVATSLGLDVRGGTVSVEGDLDFRGTLSVDKQAPVGFTDIRVRFDLDTDASAEEIATLTKLTERYNLKYTFDVYNLTNTTSFDIPGNEVFQNQYFNQFPSVNQTALPTGCDANGNQTNESFYNCPAGLGFVTHAIGSP